MPITTTNSNATNINPFAQNFDSEVLTLLYGNHQAPPFYSRRRNYKKRVNSYENVLKNLIFLMLLFQTCNATFLAEAAATVEQNSFEKDKSPIQSNLSTFALKTLNVKLLKAVENSDYESQVAAIKEGANVEIKNKLGETPLQIAIKKRNARDVSLLLQANADPNAFFFNIENSSYLNLPALHYTASIPEMYSITKQLLKYVDVDKLAQDNMTALMIAAEYNNIQAVELLLQYGANHLLRNSHNLDALQIARLMKSEEVQSFLELYTKVKSREIYAEELLKTLSLEQAYQLLIVFSANDNHYEETKWLLESFDLDVNQADNNKNTPVYYTASINKGTKTLELLIKYAANLNVACANLNTPLLIAIAENNVLLALELLSYEVDIYIKNIYGFDANLLAKGFSNECHEIIKFIDMVNKYILAKEYREAIQYIKTIPITLQKQVIFIKLRLICLEALGKFNKALEEVNRSLLIYPNHYVLNFFAGKLYFKQYDLQKASEHFGSVVKFRPNHPELNYYIAFIYYLTNNYYTVEKQNEMRLSDLILSHPLPPYDVTHYKEIFNVSEQLHPIVTGYNFYAADAELIKQQYTNMLSQSANGYHSRAIEIGTSLLEELKKLADIPYFSVMFSEIYYRLGIIYEKNNQLEEATEALKIAVGLSGKDFYLMVHLANILEKRGKSLLAFKIYMQAFNDIDSNFKNIQAKLGNKIELLELTAENLISFFLEKDIQIMEGEHNYFSSIIGLLHVSTDLYDIQKYILSNQYYKVASSLFYHFKEILNSNECDTIEAIIHMHGPELEKKLKFLNEKDNEQKFRMLSFVNDLLWLLGGVGLFSLFFIEKFLLKKRVNYVLTMDLLKKMLESFNVQITECDNKFNIKIMNGSFKIDVNNEITINYDIKKLKYAILSELKSIGIKVIKDEADQIVIQSQVDNGIVQIDTDRIRSAIKFTIVSSDGNQLREKLPQEIKSQLEIFNKIKMNISILKESSENLTNEFAKYPENILTITKENKSQALYAKYIELRKSFQNKIDELKEEIQEMSRILIQECFNTFEHDLKQYLRRSNDKASDIHHLNAEFNKLLTATSYSEFTQKINKKLKAIEALKTNFRSTIDVKKEIYERAKEDYLKKYPAQINMQASNVQPPIMENENQGQNNNNNNSNSNSNSNSLVNNENLSKNQPIIIKNLLSNHPESDLSILKKCQNLCAELTVIKEFQQLLDLSDNLPVEAQLLAITFKLVQIRELLEKLTPGFQTKFPFWAIRRIRNFYRHEARKIIREADFIKQDDSKMEDVKALYNYTVTFADNINRLITHVLNPSVNSNGEIYNIKTNLINLYNKLEIIKDRHKIIDKDKYLDSIEIEVNFIISLSAESSALKINNDPNYIECVTCAIALLGEAIWQLKTENQELWNVNFSRLSELKESTINSLKDIFPKQTSFENLSNDAPILEILLADHDKTRIILNRLNPIQTIILCLEFFTLFGKGALLPIVPETLNLIAEHIKATIPIVVDDLKKLANKAPLLIFIQPGRTNNNNHNNEENLDSTPAPVFGMKAGKAEEK